MAAPEAVSRFWKEFGLESRRGQFDATGFQIAEEQEESVQRRRQLAEATQKFRKGADKAVVTTVAELLKQYQQEIDRLTKRAKFGERAFLDVYHVLQEAPDPSSALEEAIGMRAHVAELEKEVRNQAQELAEYSAESAEIRNQGTTIRRMEEKIRSLEQQLQNKEVTKDDIRKEVEKEVHEAAEAREVTLKRLVDEANQKVEATRKQHQASQDQLLVMQSKNEELKAQYTTELEMATAEIEKTHNRIAELEAEQQRSPTPTETTVPTKAETGMHEQLVQLNASLEEEQRRTASLEEQIIEMRQTKEELKAEAEAQEASLKAELRQREETVVSLEAELEERPTNADLEELKQQLRVLQTVEYNADVSIEELPNKVDSMEALLIRKNKHLEHQLTSEKLKQSEVQQQLMEHQALLTTTQGELERYKDLVVRLEEDLLTAQNSNNIRTVSSTSDMDEALQDATGGSSMVSILRNQRDRLRQRTQDLEAKVNETEKRNRTLKSECDSISADNVALVERLRYLQGYRKEHANKLDVESGLAAEQKYEKKYEERMNPFQEFQGRQREQRRKALSLVDRTVLIVGDLVFGYKYARIFLCLYIMLLHVLIMTMLGIMSDHHHKATTSSEELQHLCEEQGYSRLP